MTPPAGRYVEGVGRRKTSVARVRLYPAGGSFTVNDRPVEQYFTRAMDLANIQQALDTTGTKDKFTVSVHVNGGGPSGQADAVRHGLARALLKTDEALHTMLRKGGYLTRDPRIKERKKPGLKRARKAPQYTKR
ncbi:MAG: 30S ribosomal protein S9 [Chloroflexi bacterium]|nr:30S ribosomal protein S9 [Chloroflexota bacterium]